MGLFGTALKAAIGYPAPGWAPPFGHAGDSIAVTVNQDSAMGVNAFTAGIRLIAEDIASLPWIVYERLPSGGKKRAFDHPMYALLHDSPNPEMTSMVFQETGIAHMYAWGDWLAEKELNGNGLTARLWPLRPDKATIEMDRTTGKRIYKYRLPNGEGVILPANRVFHVPGFGFDGLRGYSRVTLMRRTLEAAIAVEEYGLRTFANDARPGVTITHPQQLSPQAKENIAKSWDTRHQGLSNAQRTAILDEGMDIKELGFAPEDAQFLESRRWTIEDVARGLRLAPHKLSDMSRATFSNIEESNIDHVVSTLRSGIVRIDQQANKDIIGLGRFFSERLIDGLMRGKLKERVEAEVQLRLNGLATEDELREIENRNPLTDEERAGLLVPLNSVPASAFDANGMTYQQRVEAVGVLVRAGFDPAGALASLGLPAVEHTGLVPVTVTLDPTTTPPRANGSTNGAAPTGAAR